MEQIIRKLVFLALFGGASVQAGLHDGLVAEYSFSGNVADSSGNGLDGVLVGATLTPDRFGNPDSAYYFNGVNNRIDLPAAVMNFERTDSFSDSFWIKTGDNDIGNIIISKMLSTVSYRGWAITLSEGVLHASMINDGTLISRLRVDSTTVLSDDVWHHVVVTYDGSSLAAGVKYYIDGGSESSVIIADTLGGTILNSASPTIGSRNNGSYYEGIIDDVRVYNRVLTSEEVSALYAIPEPSSIGLFALASGLGLAFRKRLRR